MAFFAAAPAMGAVKRYTYTTGPVTVGGYQVKQGFLGAPRPPGNGSVLAMDVDVVDENGRQVPISRLMLHHIVFVNLAQRDRTCDRITSIDSVSRLPGAERFYGAGEERAKLALPPGYGYNVGRNDPWALTYMFMNHRATVDRAYIRYNLTWTDEPRTHVEPHWLDVKNCLADPVFDAPGGRRRGSTFRKNWDWTAPEGGRIVAGGGHVHGGAKNLVLRRRGCDSNHIYRSKPVWGGRRHSFYRVRPILHEPGPINMSGFNSRQGFPVAAGETLRLSANYDGELPHTRVMGIMVVYIAKDGSVRQRCGRRPSDLVEAPQPRGRRKPPRFKVPIVGMRNGRARSIKKPRGRRVRFGRRATVRVGDRFFRRANISVSRGARVRWLFQGSEIHNVTLANGPRGFSSVNSIRGDRYSKRLRVPGTYRLFCALHPVDMTQTIKVRRKRKRR